MSPEVNGIYSYESMEEVNVLGELLDEAEVGAFRKSGIISSATQQKAPL